MAKPSIINNALIFFLIALLGVTLPVSAWFLLRTMTLEAVIDIKLKRLDALTKKFEEERKTHVGEKAAQPERTGSHH